MPVPYAGAAPAIAALRGGHIEGVVLSLGALSAHIKSGAFRGLVASSRFPEFADIPTMRELGYREELFGIWFSVLAPAGIPEDARKALVGAIEQAVKAPTITARLLPLGILQSYAAPEQMATEIREEIKRVSEMARKTRLIKYAGRAGPDTAGPTPTSAGRAAGAAQSLMAGRQDLRSAGPRLAV